MTRLDPVHPGEVLKHDFMMPLGLTDSGLAKAIGVTPGPHQRNRTGSARHHG